MQYDCFIQEGVVRKQEIIGKIQGKKKRKGEKQK